MCWKCCHYFSNSFKKKWKIFSKTHGGWKKIEIESVNTTEHGKKTMLRIWKYVYLWVVFFLLFASSARFVHHMKIHKILFCKCWMKICFPLIVSKVNIYDACMIQKMRNIRRIQDLIANSGRFCLAKYFSDLIL